MPPVTLKPSLSLDKCVSADTTQAELILQGHHVFVHERLQETDDVFRHYIGGVYAQNRPCEMCGRLFYGVPMIGIPIQAGPKVIDGESVMMYEMDGAFHSFECAARALMHITHSTLTVADINPVYEQSEHLLHRLFRTCWPGESMVLDHPISQYHPFQGVPSLLCVPVHIGKKA